MPAMPGSKVFTNTPLVHEARCVVVFPTPDGLLIPILEKELWSSFSLTIP